MHGELSRPAARTPWPNTVSHAFDVEWWDSCPGALIQLNQILIQPL